MESALNTYRSQVNAIAQLRHGVIMTSFTITTSTITTPLRG